MNLYELITERAGGSLILTSNRAPQDWYPLFPNPVVAESLLDRVINNSHQVFMNGPSYRPNKRPGRRVTRHGGRPPSRTEPDQAQVNYVTAPLLNNVTVNNRGRAARI